MPAAAALLTLLALAAGGAAALLTANLVTAVQAHRARREKLLEAVRLKRQAHRDRVHATLAAFNCEFEDVEIEFDAKPILSAVSGEKAAGRG